MWRGRATFATITTVWATLRRVACRLIVLVDLLAHQHHHHLVVKPATTAIVATVDCHPEANKLKLRKPNNEGKMG